MRTRFFHPTPIPAKNIARRLLSAQFAWAMSFSCQKVLPSGTQIENNVRLEEGDKKAGRGLRLGCQSLILCCSGDGGAVFGRRTAQGAAEDAVKVGDRFEARFKGNFRHTPLGVEQQPFGLLDARAPPVLGEG